ncbi:MAG: hypothetical protein ACTIKR_13820 [Advenella sp.]|uniref:Uncharacterized protein n=1 Tax=Advenella kashmirensis TaxID=310575 RepID=A0A356LHL5_9BURK|nr:hypothetical protein [Advenella kashmirensis]
MKSFIKLLILLLVAAAIAFGAWKIIETTLFNDDDVELPQQSELRQPPPAPVPPPKQEDPYQNAQGEDASNDSAPVTLTCIDASKIIAELYDMRVNGKTQDEANEAVSNNTAIPDERVSSFIEFVELLWSTPKEKIVEKNRFIKDFTANCDKLAQAASSAPAAPAAPETPAKPEAPAAQ